MFAGPGTGKTETLARRFASLVVDDGIDPSAILVLTFSRRAAEQMLDRVVLRLRERTSAELAVSELFVRTFHSFCARLLDGDGPRFRERNLLTPVKERLLWKRVAARAVLRSFEDDVRTSAAFAADALNLIAQLKGQGVTSADIAGVSGRDPRLTDVATLYRELDGDRLRLNLSDFRDLVTDALAELARPDSPASRWLRERGGFKHILVDEFQDSDKLQLQLLEILAGDDRTREHPAPEICFVGDFNQSIYRFRGASPENITAARAAFRCRELTLKTNRRSAQAILDVANKTPRLDPASLTKAEDPSLAGSVNFLRATSPDAEIEYICDSIAARIAAGTPAREIAVLLRVSEPYTSRVISALDARGIPVAARPAAGFLEDPIIGAVLTTLRLLGDLDNDQLWTRLLTNPIVGFRAVSVRMAFDAARRNGVGNAFVALRDQPPVGVRAFSDFLAAWRRVEREARTGDIAALIASIAREFDLLRPVRDDTTPPGWESASSPARLGVLLEAARDLDTVSRALGDGRIEATRFVADIEEIAGLLADPTEVPPTGSDGVRVMSIHAAKGLEFDVVIVPQAIEGVLPQRDRGHALLPAASLRTLRDIAPTLFAGETEIFQEECSLWYVALTRARRAVLVTVPAADADDIELPLSQFTRAIGAPLPAHASVVGERSGLGEGRTVLGPSSFGIDGLAVQARRPLRHLVDHLTPSVVETYLTCPRRFLYKEVLHLAPERDAEGTLLGTILHRALAAFHETERDFTSATIGDERREDWLLALRGHADQAAREIAPLHGLALNSNFIRYELALAHQYMGKYVRWLADEAAAAPFAVLDSEVELETEIGGVRFRGRADRIDRLVSGGLAIRDYKSGRSRPKTVKAIRTALARMAIGEPLAGNIPDGLNVQTLLYIPGAEAKFGERVVRVEYLYFRGKKGQTRTIETDSIEIVPDEDGGMRESALSRAEVARAQNEIAASVAHALADGRLTAFVTAFNVETCLFCDFVRACPGALAVSP